MSMNNYFEEIGAWPHGTRSIARAYVAGFILSLLLTLCAYFLVVDHALPYEALVGAIILLALAQFFVQLVCFLHLSKEKGSRERLFAMCAACVVVFILVSGSLWIMLNLSGRMMPSTAQMEEYMNDQSGF